MSLEEEIVFENNTANIGACIKYENLAPNVTNYNLLSFANNTAEYYGSKFSSGYPTKIKFISEKLDNSISYEVVNDSILEEEYWLFNDIASG